MSANAPRESSQAEIVGVRVLLVLLPILITVTFYGMCSQAETWESSADEHPQPSNDDPIYALVIGINVYQNLPDSPVLEAAVADADAFEEFLVNQLNVLQRNIISLRDDEATRQGILDAFKTLDMNTAAAVDPCIIIYYAGCGGGGPKPKGWEDWATDTELIDQLCPSDLGAVVDGQVIQGIPDRIICGLVNSLAEKRGNNISLIMDCSFYTGGNNRPQELETIAISRHMPYPPPLTAEANPLVDQCSADASAATGAARRKSGFGSEYDHSHVLLAACSRGYQAFEMKDGEGNNRGVFTAALLKSLNRGKLEEVTYESLVENLKLNTPLWQAPYCIGANSDRPVFNRGRYRSDPFYLPCKRIKSPHGQMTFILYAGKAQGIEHGQQFSIHERVPFGGGKPLQPSIGTMYVVSLDPTSSRLEFLPGTRELRRVPQEFYAHPLPWAGQDPSTIYCQDRQLLDAIFPPGVSEEGIKYAEYPTQAGLILTVEGDQVHIDQNNPALKDYIPARFTCSVNRNETYRLQKIIRSWRHFNYHLHRRPQNSTNDAFPQVRMELHFLKSTSDDYFSPEYRPVGENLLAQEPAVVPVSDVNDLNASVLGMTLYNDGPKPVYPYLFYFDPNDLTITPWVATDVSGRPVDAPLLPRSQLALGYENGGAPQWEFVFLDDRPKDIGFFKLFLSSSSANFACLTRKRTPFERDTCTRLAEESDEEAEEAGELETTLDDSKESWGVKMATLIQIRK